jgi:hypothetical protein
VNYSLLHNRRGGLFDKFQLLRKPWAGRLPNVSVEVNLFVGEDTFPFRTTLTMSESQTMVDLTDKVIVPLTSSLLRTQSEAVRSVVSARVEVGDRVILSETRSVTLNPVDQWTDTDLDRLWLPSFVFPRDAAVARVVQHAQRYLMAIMDDPGAGFDGYQSVDLGEGEIGEAAAPVDWQVQAIWSSLMYDQRLTYINPPPSYLDAQSRREQAPQRLRIPSEIMHWRHGTCIDLTLLLCSCLEYIDVYPVVFLLDGHAFPGYWRSDVLHDRFMNREDVDRATLSTPQGETMIRAVSSQRVQDAFLLEKNDYVRIRNAVAQGHLVPLESVWLTNHSSFGESLDEGRKNLRSRADFNSMLDVRAARDVGVLPMPVLWKPE